MILELDGGDLDDEEVIGFLDGLDDDDENSR